MLFGLFDIKFNPESLCMIVLAGALDLTGVVLLLCGIDDFGMTDMIGIAYINTWLIIRGIEPTHKQGKKGMIKNFKSLFTHKQMKFLLPTFTEIIPYLGALPMWTLSVLCNLDKDKS